MNRFRQTNIVIVIVVKQFNDYFVNVGPTLASKIPPVPVDITDYIKNSRPNSMFLDSADANEVCHVINTLKLSNSKGIYGFVCYCKICCC